MDKGRAIVFLLIGLSTLVSFSEAVTKYYIGPDAGQWSTAANWFPSGVPGTTDDVILFQAVSCEIKVAATVRSLTVHANGTCAGVLAELKLSAGSVLTVTTSVTVGTCGRLNLNNPTTNPPCLTTTTVNSAGAILGGGAITGDVNNFGLVFPGWDFTSPRTIVITGNFWQNGTYLALVSGNAQNHNNDLIQVSGSATIGGQLGVYLPSKNYADFMSIPLTFITGNPITGTWSISVDTWCRSNCPTTGGGGGGGGGGGPTGKNTLNSYGVTSYSGTVGIYANGCNSDTTGTYAVLLSTSTCTCSTGWSGSDCSIPVCSNSCSGHGTCLATQPTPTCQCSLGWQGTDCSTPDCPGTPDCSFHGSCITTSGTPYCTCSTGWTGANCSTPVCPGTPQCSGNGICSALSDPPVCSCSSGWSGSDCATVYLPCSSCVNGVCDTSIGVCQCNSGWTGSACSTLRCPGTTECSNHGYCNTTTGVALCQCSVGFTGTACETVVECPGTPACTGHGSCSISGAVATCTCATGWTGSDCSVPVCPGVPECSAHGSCYALTSTPVCNCDTGYIGDDCSVYDTGCPGYPDCSNNGACNISDFSCTCNPGWTGSACSILDCPGTPDCSLHGTCSSVNGTATCTCEQGYFLSDCSEFRGCLNDCTGNHGTCMYNPDPVCSCTSYWSGADCSVPLCDNDCSGHGTCMSDTNPPTCQCDYNWAGVACDIPDIHCPGNPECSTDHGSCNRTSGVCTCAPGLWDGLACEIGTCINNCNLRGTCVVSGSNHVCQCKEGWGGADCGTPLCPQQCSSQGVCDGSGFIPKCVCSPGYEGTDCALEVNLGYSQLALTSNIAGVDVPIGYMAIGFVAFAIIVVSAFIFIYNMKKRSQEKELEMNLRGSAHSVTNSITMD